MPRQIMDGLAISIVIGALVIGLSQAPLFAAFVVGALLFMLSAVYLGYRLMEYLDRSSRDV